MSKIVIIAPSDVDLKDAIKLLKADGHEVDTEEPTPKSLLHIVMGLLGPNAYGFGSEYAVTSSGVTAPAADEEEPPPPDEEKPEEEPSEESSDEGGDDFNFESLQLDKVEVDGELIEAVRTDQPKTVLAVSDLVIGSKTSYKLNESLFAFWPVDLDTPTQRIRVETPQHCASVEVAFVKAEKTQLLVGADIADMFRQ